MAKDFSEDLLIQKSTAELLEKELGWKSVYAFDSEVLGENGTLGRKTQSEVVLTRHLRLALKRLNHWMTDKQLAEAIERMTSYMSSQTLMQINEEKYQYLRDGVPVTRLKPNGETETVKARVMDFANVDNNEFIAVRELWIKGPIHKRRADVVCFVNGLPLIFIELKNHDQDIQNAYTDNYRDYLDTIPHLFHHNAMIMLSNGMESRVGTVGAKWEFFHEWKRLTELDHGNIELPTMLRGICKKENLLDLLENFILFDHSGGSTAKILARNHQYLGVNQAVEMYRHREEMKGKLGVFWHTQGSGKSYSMVFLAQKIRRKFEGSPTIVVLTDRDELNKQISDTFENCGLLGGLKAKQFIAHSGEDLRQKLQGNPSFIFSLIQKFNKADAEPVYPDHDIIVMSDEAHRTQNGVFADNLMHMLPTANRIGFTGTPLLRDDNITARTFGQYVSVYDFKRAVEDKATVPLYYENRGEKLQELKNPEINAEIAARLDEENLDPSQQAKLEREFAQEVHLLTAEKRLRVVAQDFVRHYSDLWTSGKAMMVSFNKVTCVRMYNYVQEYWQKEIKALRKEIENTFSIQEAQEMKRKLQWMEETEMADSAYADEEKLYATIAYQMADAFEWVPLEGLDNEVGEYISDFSESHYEKCSEKDFAKFISNVNHRNSKPVVILIDEVDQAGNYPSFLKLLALLRRMYLDRDIKPTFQSVILAGVYDIKNLKQKIRTEDSHQYNSPWNIAVPFDVDMSLSAKGIADMLAEYKADYNLKFDEVFVGQMIRDYTAGYPFLVSRICQIIDAEQYTWDRDGVLKAVNFFVNSEEEFCIDIRRNLTEDINLYKLLEEVTKGQYVCYMPYGNGIKKALEYDYIKRMKTPVEIASKIHEDYLVSFCFNKGKQSGLLPSVELNGCTLIEAIV